MNRPAAESVLQNTISESPVSSAIAPPPLSLYAHLPWCVRKCPYCDFNSHRAPREIPERDYVRALLADAETFLPQVWGRRIASVFVGGGTPSLFSAQSINELLQGLRARFAFSSECEITLEANPGAADEAKFGEFAAAGINRLSLGAQSFDDDALTALGRIHDGKQSRKAANAAAKTFANFNLDLMHALPGKNMQNAKGAAEDLRIALSFAPPHLSLYQLTLEPGTPFFRHPPPLPDADETADIGDAVFAAAENAGFRRYEISAFALPQKECRHNLNYWRFGDYIGIGAGAHAKITIAGKIVRHSRVKNPREYMRRALSENAAAAIAETREVSGREAVFEFLLNALRLPDGFPPQMLYERAGMPPPTMERAMQSCENDGLLFRDVRVIRPTAKGLRYLNEMLARFLPE